MALTKAQQAALAHAYAPILFFHPDETNVPVRPDTYLLASSLWRGNDDTKGTWGKSSNPGAVYPRLPNIPRMGISLNPADDTEGTRDTDGDGVNEWYLGHSNMGVQEYLSSNGEIESWLDMAGWQDGEAVLDNSKNQACNIERATKRWNDEPALSAAKNWYFAEVMELDELSRLVISFQNGLDPVKILKDVIGDAWVIWYYFLYPTHQEFLRRCEQFFDKASDGNYEGDWNAIGVLVKKPAAWPWETPTPSPQFPPPELVGFGVRLRGLSKDLATDATLFKQGMIVRAWKDVFNSGASYPGTNHPYAYVAKGYHNNYSRTGVHHPTDATLLGIELEKLACGAVEGVDHIIDDVKDTWSDVKETAKDVVVTLAKVVAGAEIGSGFLGVGALIGALAGAVAGLVEALSSSADQERTDDEWTKMEEEHPPDAQNYGLILTTPDAPMPVTTTDPDPAKNDTFTDIQFWAGNDADKLVDRSHQLWWPGTDKKPGYTGRWGVRVQEDPMQRRSGITFPDFQRSLLNDIVIHLSSLSV